MGMLDRYKKPGGFVQLLALVETCGQAKQEKFLEIIRSEDPRWAEAVKQRMLSIDRIYSWSDETLAEIFGTLQDLTVAVALFAAPDALRERINSYFSHGRKRKIEDLFGSSNPTATEIAATHMKIIESVRKMEQDGFLRFEKIDSELEVQEDIEETLAKAVMPTPTANVFGFGGFGSGESDVSAESSKPEAVSNEGGESRIMEIQSLKKRVAELSKESAVLRHELSLARSKLEQIKKIA